MVEPWDCDQLRASFAWSKTVPDSTDRIERAHHENGELRYEGPYCHGLLHGVVRIWHDNGVLAREMPMDRGIEHGVVRQWDRDGKLLGEYAMVQGTGVQKLWYPNGRLASEISMANNQFTGRMICWWADGSISNVTYHIRGRQLSRKKYLLACETDPTLPRYSDNPRSGGIPKDWPSSFQELGAAASGIDPARIPAVSTPPPHARPRARKERDADDAARHDASCQDLIRQPGTCDAREWFCGALEGEQRTLGEIATMGESKVELDALYKAGPVRVFALGIDRYPEVATENTGKLLVELPTEKQARRRVLAWCTKWARATGHDPVPDFGQRYAFVMMD